MEATDILCLNFEPFSNFSQHHSPIDIIGQCESGEATEIQKSRKDRLGFHRDMISHMSRVWMTDQRLPVKFESNTRAVARILEERIRITIIIEVNITNCWVAWDHLFEYSIKAIRSELSLEKKSYVGVQCQHIQKSLQKLFWKTGGIEAVKFENTSKRPRIWNTVRRKGRNFTLCTIGLSCGVVNITSSYKYKENLKCC